MSEREELLTLVDELARLPMRPDKSVLIADDMRVDLVCTIRALLGHAQTAPEPAIVRQHIAWLFQYVQGMEASNWRDMKMNAERQLEQLSLMFPGRAHSSTDRECPFCSRRVFEPCQSIAQAQNACTLFLHSPFKRGKMTDRKEVMWCTDCGARFTDEEIKGWGCPKCGSEGIPCGCDKDTTVEVNWHELHILCVWAENFARQCKDKGNDKSSEGMPVTVQAIARRLQRQHPTFGHLTLSGEIAALPADLAASGIHLGPVDTNVPKPGLLIVNGPGAVGHSVSPAERGGAA